MKAAKAALVALILVPFVFPQTTSWTLPVPEDPNAQVSPPSIQGEVFAARKDTLVIRRDRQDGAPGGAIPVRLASATEYFTLSGDPYTPEELVPGQYVWVWFVSANPARAGKPPRTAVVMLWSKNPSEKPSPEVRWKFQKK